MTVPFTTLPETARIWIYQANRSFTEQETQEIAQKLTDFLENWTAHGTGLEAAFEIRYNRFIVIGLNQDTHAASGCSIDASVHCIQQLENDYHVDLLDKMNVSFRKGNTIVYQPLKEFKKAARHKAVTGKTVVFNNLVVNKEEYETAWEVPASASWHARFFK